MLMPKWLVVLIERLPGDVLEESSAENRRITLEVSVQNSKSRQPAIFRLKTQMFFCEEMSFRG